MRLICIAPAIAKPIHRRNHRRMDALSRDHRTLSPEQRRLAMSTLAFALFVAGWFTGGLFVDSRGVSDLMNNVVEYDLWEVLIGALTGMAAASAIYLASWLGGVWRLAPNARPLHVVWWILVAAVIIAPVFGVLFNGGGDSIDSQLGRQTRPVTIGIALCALPGLAAFIGIRHIAADSSLWGGSGDDQLRLLRRLQAEVRRLLTLLGALLTLIVVVTGMRRNALLAYEEATSIEATNLPAAAVLVYGLAFAVILGVFYQLASGGIDRRAADILDHYAPLPDPSDPALSDKVRRRTDLATLTGGTASWQTFQTTVLITAPLVTGLIGAATG
jgi:hypothetical protein